MKLQPKELSTFKKGVRGEKSQPPRRRNQANISVATASRQPSASTIRTRLGSGKRYRAKKGLQMQPGSGDGEPPNYEYLADKFPSLTKDRKEEIEGLLSEHTRSQGTQHGGLNKKASMARSESLSQFAEFVSGAVTKPGAWKKFLNHKIGIEEEGEGLWSRDTAAAVQLQSRVSCPSLPQQITLQLFAKAQEEAKEEQKAEPVVSAPRRLVDLEVPKTRLEANREKLKRNEAVLQKVLNDR